MKKNWLFLFVFLTCRLWAQSLTDFYFIFGGDWYLRGGEKIYRHENLDADMYAVYDADNGNKIAKMSLYVNESGYVILMYEDTFYTILGNNIGCLANDTGASDYVLPSFVKSIHSANYLTENIDGKQTEYKAENLLKSAVWGGRENPYAYNSSNTPFAPQRNQKNGVGTTLSLALKKPQKKILILGGYVDPIRHQDYYYKNCRPKTIKIKDLDSDYTVICDLQDFPVYQSFDFAKPLSNIEIEVLEVYKGTKYSDLCISGILF